MYNLNHFLDEMRSRASFVKVFPDWDCRDMLDLVENLKLDLPRSNEKDVLDFLSSVVDDITSFLPHRRHAFSECCLADHVPPVEDVHLVK